MMSRRALAAVACLLVVAGCRQAANVGPSTVASMDAASDPSHASAPPVSAPASAGPSGVSVTPGLPAGFPLPPGAEELTLEAGSSLIARWEVNGPGNEVYDFFNAQLPAAGYALDLAGPGGEASIFRFTTPDGRQLQVDLIGAQPVRIELGPVHE